MIYHMGLRLVVCYTRFLYLVVMLSYFYATTIIEVRQIFVSYFLIYLVYSCLHVL
jgi:hypothetical protein